jgi:hypothetical protein
MGESFLDERVEESPLGKRPIGIDANMLASTRIRPGAIDIARCGELRGNARNAQSLSSQETR